MNRERIGLSYRPPGYKAGEIDSLDSIPGLLKSNANSGSVGWEIVGNEQKKKKKEHHPLCDFLQIFFSMAVYNWKAAAHSGVDRIYKK